MGVESAVPVDAGALLLMQLGHLHAELQLHRYPGDQHPRRQKQQKQPRRFFSSVLRARAPCSAPTSRHAASIFPRSTGLSSSTRPMILASTSIGLAALRAARARTAARFFSSSLKKPAS